MFEILFSHQLVPQFFSLYLQTLNSSKPVTRLSYIFDWFNNFSWWIHTRYLFTISFSSNFGTRYPQSC